MSTTKSTDARAAEPSADADAVDGSGSNTPFGRASRSGDAPSSFREAVASAWRFRR
jgi:hypothetical protein